LTLVSCASGAKTTSKHPYSDVLRNGLHSFHMASEEGFLKCCRLVGSLFRLAPVRGHVPSILRTWGPDSYRLRINGTSVLTIEEG
jgi:hypothetical protein